MYSEFYGKMHVQKVTLCFLLVKPYLSDEKAPLFGEMVRIVLRIIKGRLEMLDETDRDPLKCFIAGFKIL